MLYATGSAGLATLVRGSSRRIKIMRFRPANIRLINRRSNLPRLLLALSSKNGKSNDNNKNNTKNVQGLTGHSISEHFRVRVNKIPLPHPLCVFCAKDGKPQMSISTVSSHVENALKDEIGLESGPLAFA